MAGSVFESAVKMNHYVSGNHDFGEVLALCNVMVYDLETLWKVGQAG